MQYVNFVGKIYSLQEFVSEAERIGVSRAIPKNVLKHFSWGDIVLLAVWEGKKGERTRRGTAKIFGYFEVSRIRHANLTVEMVRELNSKLNVKKEIVEPLPTAVSRGCGSYYVGGLVIVENTIREIVSKSEEIEKKYGVKIKWFVEGDFRKLDNMIVIENVPFTRGVLKVDIPGNFLEGQQKSAGVVVYSYDYVKYSSRKDKLKATAANLEKYIS